MDLDLISAEFLSNEIPRHDYYYRHFFHTDDQRAFFLYYLKFVGLKERNSNHLYQNFVDHTGFSCTKRTFQKWEKRFHEIRGLVKKANENYDFVMLERIYSGDLTVLKRRKRSISKKKKNRDA